MLCSDTIYQAFLDDAVARAFLHSHSYTGNPLACRAALATLDIFAEDDVITVNRGKSQKMAQALAPQDISAVAAWLAAQPVPQAGHPATQLPAPLPMRCGGVTP